jgi:energy-coupling factor transporter ATP-binding protein EcfA2
MSSTAAGPSTAGARVSREVESCLADFHDLLTYYLRRGLAGEDLTEAELRFSFALASHRFRPPTGMAVGERCQVMVFGGAGAGKSTVANMLAGAEAVESNPQAGYTRSPTALHRLDGEPSSLWPERLGILHRTDRPLPGDTDEDLFGWRRLDQSLAPDFLGRCTVWDTPDLTTRHAIHYEARVIEIAALADVAVYVASDERYNDELPGNFLQALLEAGKPVVVALTKCNPEDANEFVRLFRSQVAERMEFRERIAAIIPVPFPGAGRVRELWTDGLPYAGRLRDAVLAAAGESLERSRTEAAKRAGEYLTRLTPRLLEPLRKDSTEYRAWLELVRQAGNDAVRRYEREFLTHVRFPEFEESFREILKTMEPTGRLLWVERGLELFRLPWRVARNFAWSFLPWGDPAEIDEDRALDQIRRELLDSLQLQASTRRTRHNFWAELHDHLRTKAASELEPQYLVHRHRQADRMHDRARGFTAKLAKAADQRGPVAKALPYLRLTLDGLAALVTLWYLGFNLLGLLGMVLAVGLIDDLIRTGLHLAIRLQRNRLVHFQKEDVRELLRMAYLEPLIRWPPSTGGRLYDLSQLEQRFPTALAAMLAGPK